MEDFMITITKTQTASLRVTADDKQGALEAAKALYDQEPALFDDVAKDSVSFDFIDETPEKDKLNVLLVEPREFPRAVTIPDSLESLQKAVGGNIEAIYPFDDPVAIIDWDEAKLNDAPLNRALADEENDVYDIISGNFLVVGLGEDNFTSLSPELMEKYEKLFHQPEAFLRLGHGLLVVAIPDEHVHHTEPKHEKGLEPILE